MTPAIRAENGPICGYRIVNSHKGKIPFEVMMIIMIMGMMVMMMMLMMMMMMMVLLQVFMLDQSAGTAQLQVFPAKICIKLK